MSSDTLKVFFTARLPLPLPSPGLEKLRCDSFVCSQVAAQVSHGPLCLCQAGYCNVRNGQNDACVYSKRNWGTTLAGPHSPGYVPLQVRIALSWTHHCICSEKREGGARPVPSSSHSCCGHGDLLSCHLHLMVMSFWKPLFCNGWWRQQSSSETGHGR